VRAAVHDLEGDDERRQIGEYLALGAHGAGGFAQFRVRVAHVAEPAVPFLFAYGQPILAEHDRRATRDDHEAGDGDEAGENVVQRGGDRRRFHVFNWPRIRCVVRGANKLTNCVRNKKIKPHTATRTHAMPPPETRNATDVAHARKKTDSTLCFWMFVAVVAIIIVGVFVVPSSSLVHPDGDHHYDDDDDDNNHSWVVSNKDDDDDDDSVRHIHHAELASNASAEKLASRNAKQTSPPDLAKNTFGVMQSYDTVLKTDYVGVHPRYIGCRVDADHIALRAASQLSLAASAEAGVFIDAETRAEASQVEPPVVRVDFDEERGSVVFSASVPYISADASYLLSFEPFNTAGGQLDSHTDLLHAPSGCQSAPPAKASATFADLWAHAPSALYNASEFPAEVSARGGAYATTNGWQVSPQSCARTKYTLTANAADLKHCRSSDGSSRLIAFDMSADIAVISGTLWLNLLWPSVSTVTTTTTTTTPKRSKVPAATAVEYMQWAFPFVLYVDTFESKLSLTDASRKAVPMPVTPTMAAEYIKSKSSAATLQFPMNSVQIQLLAAQWSASTALVNVWFDPSRDEAMLGGDNDTLIVDTEQKQARAMRIHLRVSLACDARPVLDQRHSAEDEAPFNERVLSDAKKMAPSIHLIGVTRHAVAAVTAKLAAYGEFTVSQPDFLVTPGEAKTCALRHEPDGGTSIECYRNLTLVLTPRHQEIYQGSFDLHLCTSECDVHAPNHTVHIDVAVTDPSADIEEAAQLQISASPHLNSANAEQLSEATFDGGDRVCIQSFAVGPQQLVQSIDLRTVAAWLCVDDRPDAYATEPPLPERVIVDDKASAAAADVQSYLKTKAKSKSGCASRKHQIQLFGSADEKQRALVAKTYNVTLHEPGSYGTWSSAMCFNSSTIFVDSNGNSVHRPRQYYQAEVVVVPTEKRRHSTQALHRTFSSFAGVAAATKSEPHHDSALRRAYAVRNSLSASFDTLTSPELGLLLSSLDARGKITRFDAVTLDVVPHSERERRLHNVHERTAVWSVAAIALCGLCIAFPLIWFIIIRRTPESPLDSSKSETSKDFEGDSSGEY
jgi:hypothetical protein